MSLNGLLCVVLDQKMKAEVYRVSLKTHKIQIPFPLVGFFWKARGSGKLVSQFLPLTATPPPPTLDTLLSCHLLPACMVVKSLQSFLAV